MPLSAPSARFCLRACTSSGSFAREHAPSYNALTMTSPDQEPLQAFVDHVVRQLEKNGFPQRSVSFPIEKMYEAAAKKELSFNKVLELLATRGIAHEKTPEKIIFSPASPAHAEPPFPNPAAFAGLDPSMFGGLDPSMLEGLNPSMLAGLSREQLMAAAQHAMQHMGPEQLNALRAMVEGLTPEQQAAMIEQVRKLGLL